MKQLAVQVLYEDNHLLAVYKPGGMLVQGDETGDTPLAELAKAFLKEKYQKPGNVFCGVIHRIDRPVSGIVLLAKTSKALSRMNEQFKQRLVQKTYLALVAHKPSPAKATLKHWLIKDYQRNTSKAYTKPVTGAAECSLAYHTLKQTPAGWLLQVMPHTGRPHQIRVQLATAASPIVGDVKYGYPSLNPDATICLHAWKLDFKHPTTGHQLQLESIPPDWAEQAI